MTVPQPLSSARARFEMSAGERRVRDYVIVYLKQGSHVGSSPWRGELEAAKQVAREGLIRRGADECQIRSDTLDGPLIWRDYKDASAMSRGPFKH